MGQLLWVFTLSALIHMVFTSGSLHALILRYHYDLDKIQIGQALFVSYAVLIVAPFGVMWMKSHLRHLWKVLGVLLGFQALALALFPVFSSQIIGMVLFTILISLASINGSLFRASSAQCLPTHNRDKLYIYLMFTAALSYGLLAFINSFWVDGLLNSAYTLFAGLALLTMLLCFWGSKTQVQSSSGLSGLTMKTFWWHRELRWTLLLLCVAVMASNAGDMYMSYFLKEELGGSDGDVSLAWAVGVLTELPLYFLSIWWLKKYSARALLWCAFGGIALRMGLLAMAPSIPIFLAAQCLDGFYSGVLFAVFPIYLTQIFNNRRLAFANLFAAVFYLGIGRALTGWASSWIWEWADLRTLFGFWAVFLVTMMLVVWWLNQMQKSHCN